MFKKITKIIILIVVIFGFLGGVQYNGIDYNELDMPIIVDGKTEQHLVTAGDIEYINSWSMKFLTINGQDYANQYITYIPNKINGMYFIDYIPKNKWGHFEIVGITDWSDTVGTNENIIDTTTIILPFNYSGIGNNWFCIEGTPTSINSWGVDTLLVNNIQMNNEYHTDFPERIDNKYYIYYKSINNWSEMIIEGSNEIYNDEIDTIYINESYNYNGIGKKMFIPTFFINNINSWLADSVSINGVDITNRYVSTFPDTIDGKYYIYYESSNTDAAINIGLTDHALPVELVNICYERIQEGILLKWITASEMENLRFDIYDKDSVFLGGVSGAGTTTELNEYEYLDTTPKYGENVYTIKEVGYNGKEKVMSTITVHNLEETINIFPNPANPEITITFNDDYNTSKKISIYNLRGKLVKDYEFAQFTEKIMVNVNDLASGTYILMFNNRYSGKFSILK